MGNKPGEKQKSPRRKALNTKHLEFPREYKTESGVRIVVDLDLLEPILLKINHNVQPTDLAEEVAEAICNVCKVPLAVVTFHNFSGEIHLAAAGTLTPSELTDNKEALKNIPELPYSGPVVSSPWGDWLAETGLKTVSGVPVVVQDQTIGILLAFSLEDTPPEVDVLRLLAIHISEAIYHQKGSRRERRIVGQLQQLRGSLAQQRGQLERLLAMQHQLSATQVLAEGFDPLVGMLGEFLGGPLLLLDKSLRLLAAVVPPVDLEGFWVRTLEDRRLDSELINNPYFQRALHSLLMGGPRFLTVEIGIDDGSRCCLLAPLRNAGEIWGFLLWQNSLFLEAQEVENILELGTMALSLAYFNQYQGSSLQVSSFLEPLLSGQYLSPQALFEQAERLGCDLSRVTRVVLLEFGTELKTQDILDQQLVAEGVAIGFGHGTYIGVYSGALVILLEANINAKGLAQTMLERYQANGTGNVVCSLSRLLHGLDDIRTGYDELRRSITLARRLGETGKVIAFDELVAYRLFFTVERSLLEDMIQQVLGPLLNEDNNKVTGLLPTITGYIRSGGSLQHTAEKCYIHLNTVKYRLKRVESLLGMDLSNPEDRFKIDFALRALEVSKL